MNFAPLLALFPLAILSDLIRSLAANPVAMVLPPGFSWNVFLTYVVALIITVTGVVTARKEAPQTGALAQLLSFGPLFMAMPMAVFACDHFIEARSISRLVPSWIPGHMFWTYFVGVALICAAISMAINRCAGLASFLLGIMFVLFEVLMHIPNILRFPHARVAWNIAMRDISFGGGALAMAVTYTQQWRTQGTHRLLWIPRLFIAVPVIVFGVESFIYPLGVPGITLNPLMPAWVPLRPVWNHATGAIEVVTGLCLLTNQKARTAAIWLGITILLLVLIVYLPILIANASSIDNGLNFFADTLVLSGVALLYARSQKPHGANEPSHVSAALTSGN
jgi:uncharacterized membrane protein YphA (DoxX/SURF4 family)